MKYGDLIDQAFLEKLERLALLWNRQFRGLVGGLKSTRYPGTGQEFFDHRLFHQGDDLRAVNWRAYLRLEKLYLKTYALEPHVPVRILLDCSASMDFGAPSKFDYARRLAASLAYIALVNLDTVTIIPFNSGLNHPITCSGGRHRFMPVAHFLANLTAGGITDFQAVCTQLAEKYARRGLCILISDFFGKTDCAPWLELLSTKGHELVLVHLWSDEEHSPKLLGEVELIEAETGEIVRLNVDEEVLEQYRASFESYKRYLESVALRNDGRYIGLSTSTPLETALFGPIAGQHG